MGLVRMGGNTLQSGSSKFRNGGFVRFIPVPNGPPPPISCHSLRAESAKKLAIVTGSNKGIGLEIVRALCKDHPGIETVLTSRDEAQGRAAVERIREDTGVEPLFHQLDITDEDSCNRLAQWIEREKGGKLDILVNNAGFAYHGCARHTSRPLPPF